jgi:hypothetical protein
MEMYEELKQLHLAVKVNQDDLSFLRPELVGGVLKIIAALCDCNDEALRALYHTRLLEFVIRDCLGFVYPSTRDGVSDSRIARLYENITGKEGAYAILGAFGRWRKDVVIEILLYLRSIHKIVPTPSVWGYDPQSDERSSSGFVGLRNMGCTCYMNSLIQVIYYLRCRYLCGILF